MTRTAANWLTLPPDWRGLRVTVMGLGLFGGGEGAVRFLALHGARVTVSDLKSAEALRPVVQRIAALPNVALHLGGHNPSDFLETDLLVVNPAVPRNHPCLQLAIDAGVPLTSEMNLFWMLHRGRTIAVTGSNGKSTTTTLIHDMLHAAGIPARSGGNIGRSLLPEVENIRPDDWTVLELSSFQLADLDQLQRSPEIAVVTNFVPNHQDRHASLDEYRAAKQTILRWQRPNDIAILNADDPDVARWPTHAKTLTFGDARSAHASINSDSIRIAIDARRCDLSLAASRSLPGRHNAMNAAAAALAASAAGAPCEPLQCALRNFQSLPHRLEFVGEHAGRRFYNDSKSTTPEAAIAAIQAFDLDTPIVLLAGGADKHVDLSSLATAIRRRVKAVALLGQTAPTLEQLLRASQSSSTLPPEPRGSSPRPMAHRATSLSEAFHWAVAQSAPGDVILLSPGCASLDWFDNYEDRGRQFVELVRREP